MTGANLVSDGDNVEKEIVYKNLVVTGGAWTPAVFRKLFPNEPFYSHLAVGRL